MNRRQFLGRVFQAILSLHNSYSTYGIYHPWRQYESNKTNVSIYLKMVTGVNPYYDPSITDKSDNRSSRYLYRSIPYTGNNGPIMAVYDDSNNMIYCSAYYLNGTLYNSISTGIYLNGVPDGTYTVKCLSLGKGLYLGESGQSISFSVKAADRAVDTATGDYNKYNNYGYINQPTVYIDFLFDYEGLSFDLDVKYTALGTDIRNIEGVKHAVYTYPSYSAVKAKYESYGLGDYTWEAYMRDAGFYACAGNVPYEYCVQYDDIYKREQYVLVYEHKGFENKTLRGKVDVTGVDGNSVTAVAYEKGFEQKALSYDPMTAMLPSGGHMTYAVTSADSVDGSGYDIYYYNTDEQRLYNAEPIIAGSRYPACGIGENGRGDCLRPDTTITSVGRAYSRQAIYTKRTESGDYDTSSRFYVSVPTIRFSGAFKYWCFGYGSKQKYEWFDNPMNGNQAEDNDTPSGNIGVRLKYYWDKLLPKAKAALETAKANWGNTDADYFFRECTQNETFQIPFDLILGKCSGNYPVEHYTGTQYSQAEYSETYYNGKVSRIDVSFPRDKAMMCEEVTELHKSVGASNVDISGYEFCTDFSTGWVDNVVLRQEIVHLDLSDVPDHQIKLY